MKVKDIPQDAVFIGVIPENEHFDKIQGVFKKVNNDTVKNFKNHNIVTKEIELNLRLKAKSKHQNSLNLKSTKRD